MDIEMLKELKKEVAESNLKVTGVGYLTDLQDLINAEIARQSVTSEDVAEAISQMNEALGTEYLESDGEWTCYNEFSTNAIRTAITALQAYQPEPPKGE